MDVKPARSLVADGTAGRSARRGRVSPPSGAVSATALFEALLDDADSGVVLLDAGGRVSRLNRAALSLLGTTPARARGARGADLLRTVVAGDDPVAEGYRRRTTDREAMLVSQRGGELPVWLKTYRVGTPPWLLVTLRDLTQLRRMHEELRRNERLALLGQLATGVAHEIRNPLAGIGTSAQVLLRRFEPRDERARFVQVILDEVARLDRIVTSLLQYSRPRTPVLQRVEMPVLVRHVHDLLAEQLAASGVQAELEFAPRLVPLHVDPDLLTQVLLNVCLNGIQAMPGGGFLRIEVRNVRRRQPPRGPGRRATDPGRSRPAAAPWSEYLQVRVSDTGQGMARGVLRKLFHPFFTTKPNGTGLGLSICQTIMHEHQGSIEVASREGRGTTVMLNFPREKRHGERRDVHAHAGDAHAARR